MQNVSECQFLHDVVEHLVIAGLFAAHHRIGNALVVEHLPDGLVDFLGFLLGLVPAVRVIRLDPLQENLNRISTVPVGFLDTGKAELLAANQVGIDFPEPDWRIGHDDI